MVTETRDRSDDSIISQQDFEAFLDDQDIIDNIRISTLTAGPQSVQDYWQQIADSTDGTVAVVGSFERGVEQVLLHSIGLEKEFQLTQVPIAPPREIVLTFRDRPEILVIEEDFDYLASRNVIRFRDRVPEVNSTVRVRLRDLPGHRRHDEPRRAGGRRRIRPAYRAAPPQLRGSLLGR